MPELADVQPFDLRAVVDDAAAFRAWYAATAPRVYAYLVSRSGSPSLAEDLTQEVFLEVLKRPGSYDGREDSVPWLVGIARHRLARHLRSGIRERGRQDRLLQEVATTDPGAEWQAAEARSVIETVLAKVGTLQRFALVLRFREGLSVRDIARELGRSEDATESLLRRAREAFERHYREAIDAD